MALEQRSYRALIVSKSEKFTTEFGSLLSVEQFQKDSVQNAGQARRSVLEKPYDLVIVNSPLPDDVGTRFAVDTALNSVVLLLVSNDVYEDVNYRVSGQGVFVLGKPFSKTLFATAVNWMRSARSIVLKSQKKTHTIEEKMEEIRIVNRAKWLLINERQMAEPEAHRYIEKQAMDRCVGKGEVAREIIDMYS